MSPLSPTKQCNQAEALGFVNSAALIQPTWAAASSRVDEADCWGADASPTSLELHKQALYGKQPCQGKGLEATPKPAPPAPAAVFNLQ